MAPGIGENGIVEDEARNGNACLIAKATNLLVSMGESKPKTLHKLSATLKSCTAVLPYLNPMEALELANTLSERAPPLVELLQSKKKVYTLGGNVDEKFWDQVKREYHEGNKRVTRPPADVEKDMCTGVLRWLRSCPEGTEESLLEELHRRCRKEYKHDMGLMIKSLQDMGFLQVDGDRVVSYFLPLSRDLLHLKDTLQKYALDNCQYGSYGMTMVRRTACYESWKYRFYNEETFIFGKSRLPARLEEAELYALCLMSEIAPKKRPRNLDDLAYILEPARYFVYIIPPSMFLTKYKKQLSHRPILEVRLACKPKSQRRRSRKVTEFAIGVSKDNPKQVVIPLSAEGLLGVTEESVDDLNGSNEAASVKRWHITGQAQGFAAMVGKHLTSKLQTQNAVLVLTTGAQTSEIIGKVSDWLDRYRGITPCENDSETEGYSTGAQTHPHPVPLKELRRELLSLCAVKVVKIPVSSIVAMLEDHGFIRIDHEDPTKPVTYLIPEVSKTTRPTWQVAADRIWKTSVKMCYSGILTRCLPPEHKIKKEDKIEPELLDEVTAELVEHRFGVPDIIYYASFPLFAVIVGLLVTWSDIF